MRSMVVLAEERLATDRLVWHLNLHPQVSIRPRGLRSGKEELDAAGQVDLLRTELTARRHRRHTVLGMSTAISAVLDTAAVTALLHELEAVVVHLAHPNVVRSTIVHLYARQLFARRWGGTPMLSTPPPEQVAFHGQRFTTALRQVERRQELLHTFVAGLDLPTVSLTDSEVLEDERATAARVIAAAGLPPLGVEPDLPPYGDERILQAVDLEALRRHLEDTAYAPLLDQLVGDLPGGAPVDRR